MSSSRACLGLAAVAALLALPAPLAAEPRDGTIGGWTAHCDAPLCRASLPSATGLQALLLGRFEAGDGIALGLATPGAIADRERPMTLRIDGDRIADLEPGRSYRPFERVDADWLIDTKLVGTILARLKTAKTLRIEYLDVTGAPHDADFDVSGTPALIAWTDESLGRTTTTPTGAAPLGLEPAPLVSRGELVVRQGLPPRLLAKHMAASDCEAPTTPLLRSIAPVIGILSSTAIVYAVPCTASGGNVSYRLWVVESGEIGGITPLYFSSFDPKWGWQGSDLLYNVAYDEKTLRLTSTRRLDGCGNRGVWRWDKWAFRMEESRTAITCATGSDPAGWPLVYSAGDRAGAAPETRP